ncbi:MAG: hypothetical protein J0M08_11355, partial [Bacteroidetes bacterium]|nr:hypothetical protein [Bacteroidota bacterium]
MHVLIYLLLGSAVLFLFFFLASCSSTKRVKDNEYLLVESTVVDKKTGIDKDDIAGYIKQKSNRKVLNFYPFYLKVYNIPNPDKVKSKRVRKDLKFANSK